jgi:predicted PurR-regulated permease PerM
MKQLPNQLLRQILFLLIILGLGVLLFWQLKFFTPAVLGAYTLYILLGRVMRWLTGRWKWPKPIAALVLMLVSFLVLCIPLIFLIQMLNIKLQQTLEHLPELTAQVESQVRIWEQQLGYEVLTPENLKNLTNWSIAETRMLLNATLDGLATLLATYFILYFMLTAGHHMERTFFNWMPLRADNAAYIKKQLHSLVFSNAVGIPAMGILQGFTGLLAYWVVGVQDPWLWFAITCFTGMLPVVGVALAYVPLSALTIAAGMTGKGVFLFLYGVFIVGSVDNVGRMLLLKKIGDTHPLITLFGVLLGLKLFGFIGFIFGPILVSLFLLLLRLYHKEYIEVLDQPEKKEPPGV